jgi:hypothetical protein
VKKDQIVEFGWQLRLAREASCGTYSYFTGKDGLVKKSQAPKIKNQINFNPQISNPGTIGVVIWSF